MKRILLVLVCCWAGFLFAQAQNTVISFTKKPVSSTTPVRTSAVSQISHSQWRGNTGYAAWQYTGIGTKGNYYSFDVASPASTISQIDTMNIYGGEYYNGNFYAFDGENNFYVFDAMTGAQISTAASSASPTDMAYDYNSGVMYAVRGTYLYSVNLTTGFLSFVTTLTKYLFTLAIDLNGNMYGIESNATEASLHRIDKTTGACTAIGTGTGYAANYIQSMGFDHNTETLYWCQCDNSTEAFCTVDTSTGLATPIVAAGFGEACGFFVPYSPNTNMANVTGTVRALSNGNAVPNAVIIFEGQTTETVTTDANGTYAVSLFQGNTYDISIVADGYNDYWQTAYTVPNADNVTLDFSIVENNQGSLIVDYSLDGFCDEDGNAIDSIVISATDGLSPRVLITNHGPDVPDVTDTLYFDIFIDGNLIRTLYFLGDQLAGLESGMTDTVYYPGNLFFAAQLDQMGLFNPFVFCYKIRLAGIATDPVSDNNQACLPIIRRVGIADVVESSFSVYPNPANEVLNITTNTIYDRLEILNYLGRTVYVDKVNRKNSQIDISYLNSGLYFVRLSGKNGVATKKFIKK